MLHAAYSFQHYHFYLKSKLCWVDGEPTHASSGQQRQCTRCRRKWSYYQMRQQWKCLLSFCMGDSQAECARQTGLAKNTVRGFYLIQ